MRLAGQRQDGSTFPARVSLSPVVTANGRFILAVIRDITEDRPQADLARTAAAYDARPGRELLSRVADDLLRVGLRLQTAIDTPGEVAVPQIADALRILDGTIREIYDHVFAVPGQDGPPDPQPPSRTS